jgi:hypothetical protein
MNAFRCVERRQGERQAAIISLVPPFVRRDSVDRYRIARQSPLPQGVIISVMVCRDGATGTSGRMLSAPATRATASQD